jgi:sortase A
MAGLRQLRRGRLSAALALAGVAALAWVAVTLVWGEPFTALSASRAQAGLRRELARESSAAPSSASAAGRARSFRLGLREGAAVGEIVIPRIHLHMVVVEGTATGDLERGAGHYAITSLPALGGTIAIAGHRTTYLAPFRHLDALHRGDRISLRMPYGTFRYVVYAKTVVGSHDWSILRRRSFEKLVLTACHPLYSASHRIVVFSRSVGAATRSTAVRRPSGKPRARQATS